MGLITTLIIFTIVFSVIVHINGIEFSRFVHPRGMCKWVEPVCLRYSLFFLGEVIIKDVRFCSERLYIRVPE